MIERYFKEFFKATEEGSTDRLEELFESIPNADPNMTQVTRKTSVSSSSRFSSTIFSIQNLY